MDAWDRIRKSKSSKDSCISKLIESSFDDSSSILVIERSAKNCRLIAPSHLEDVRSARAEAVNWTKQRPWSERTGGIDLSMYSPRYQRRSQASYQSLLNDIILLTNDEMQLLNDRFSYGDRANFPKYPSFLDSSESGRLSIGTLSDLSGAVNPLSISHRRSDAHHVSDPVTISWPHVASTEDCVKQLSCLSCVRHTVNERGLTQENKQNRKRIDFTSNVFDGSAFLGVMPVEKQYSTPIDRKLPLQVATNTKGPSSKNVIKAD